MSDQIYHVLQRAKDFLSELRTRRRNRQICAKLKVDVDGSFKVLDDTLMKLSQELQTKSDLFSKLDKGALWTQKSLRNTPEIVSEISRYQSMFNDELNQEFLKKAKSSHEKLVTELKGKIATEQENMKLDNKTVRRMLRKLERDFEEQTSKLLDSHRRNLAVLQESFKSSMLQIENSKSHKLCELRERSLGMRGEEVIQRLDAQMEVLREEIVELRGIASRKRMIPLVDMKENESPMNSSGAEKLRATPAKRFLVDSSGANSTENEPNKRKTNYSENPNQTSDSPKSLSLSDENLNEYLTDLKKLVNNQRDP